MSKIKLLIADANSNFSTDEIEIFQRSTELAEIFILKNFDLDYEVNVIVVSPSYLLNVIPEDGIGGRTYRSDLIIITVDTKSGISEDFFYETLCHELSHSIRWERVPEHSTMLFDNIILEGLAIVLEEKAMIDGQKSDIQYFLKEMQSTDVSTINQILSILKSNLNDNEYDYNKIFINGDNELPRWAGYKLGYHLVKEYLRGNNSNINKATLDSYCSFKNYLKI